LDHRRLYRNRAVHGVGYLVKLVKDFPPNFDKINAAFDLRGRKGIFYCYGDIIYSPHSHIIPPELEMHEQVHSTQQGADIEGWWDQYIENPAFRLAQEIPAHREEWRYLFNHGNRNQRRRALKTTVRRLSNGFYGNIITPREAKRVLQNGF